MGVSRSRCTEEGVLLHKQRAGTHREVKVKLYPVAGPRSDMGAGS